MNLCPDPYNTISFTDRAITTTVTKTQLPNITRPVRINGITAGSAGVVITTNPMPGSVPANANGLTFSGNSSGSQLMGLTIDGFQGNGILINNVSNVQVGVSTGGSVVGVTVTRSGTAKGSVASGINISGVNAKGNVVIGSYIGTNEYSQPGLGNNSKLGGLAGITIWQGPCGNRIGGMGPGERNVLSATTGEAAFF